eukprot:152102_1
MVTPILFHSELNLLTSGYCRAILQWSIPIVLEKLIKKYAEKFIEKDSIEYNTGSCSHEGVLVREVMWDLDLQQIAYCIEDTAEKGGVTLKIEPWKRAYDMNILIVWSALNFADWYKEVIPIDSQSINKTQIIWRVDSQCSLCDKNCAETLYYSYSKPTNSEDIGLYIRMKFKPRMSLKRWKNLLGPILDIKQQECQTILKHYPSYWSLSILYYLYNVREGKYLLSNDSEVTESTSKIIWSVVCSRYHLHDQHWW